MNVTDLREQIAIELEAMEATLAEIASLCRDIGDRRPSTREVAAAGLFLANFYNGVENILKRLCVFHGASLPSGDTWQGRLLRQVDWRAIIMAQRQLALKASGVRMS